MKPIVTGLPISEGFTMLLRYALVAGRLGPLSADTNGTEKEKIL